RRRCAWRRTSCRWTPGSSSASTRPPPWPLPRAREANSMAEKQHPAQAVREMTDGEIVKAMDDAQRELFNLRMRHATRQLENQQATGRVRKHIARLKTIQTERRLGLKRG